MKMARAKAEVRRSKITMLPEKLCGICGVGTVQYQVIDNACVCFDCVPRQEDRLILSEKKMIQKILKK